MAFSDSGFSASRIIYLLIFLAIGVSLYYFLPSGTFLKGDVTQPSSSPASIEFDGKTYVEVSSTLRGACEPLGKEPGRFVSDLPPDEIKKLFPGMTGRFGYCANHPEFYPYSITGVMTCKQGANKGKFCSEYLDLAKRDDVRFEESSFSDPFFFSCSSGKNTLGPDDDLSDLSSKVIPGSPSAPRWFSSAVGECVPPQGTLNLSFQKTPNAPAGDFSFSIPNPEQTSGTNVGFNGSITSGEYDMSVTVPSGAEVIAGENYSLLPNGKVRFNLAQNPPLHLIVKIGKACPTGPLTYRVTATYTPAPHRITVASGSGSFTTTNISCTRAPNERNLCANGQIFTPDLTGNILVQLYTIENQTNNVALTCKAYTPSNPGLRGDACRSSGFGNVVEMSPGQFACIKSLPPEHHTNRKEVAYAMGAVELTYQNESQKKVALPIFTRKFCNITTGDPQNDRFEYDFVLAGINPQSPLIFSSSNISLPSDNGGSSSLLLRAVSLHGELVEEVGKPVPPEFPKTFDINKTFSPDLNSNPRASLLQNFNNARVDFACLQ